MSFHTRLDSVAFGVNNALAEKLGLESVCQLGDNYDCGSIGCIGECKEQRLEDFFAMLKESLGSSAVNVAKGCDTVKKVAVVGGAGDDYLFKAVSKGADTFITGEVHHHIYMLAKSLGINIIGAGHHITEDPVLPVLAEKLNDINSSIDFEIYNSNPTVVI